MLSFRNEAVGNSRFLIAPSLMGSSRGPPGPTNTRNSAHFTSGPAYKFFSDPHLPLRPSAGEEEDEGETAILRYADITVAACQHKRFFRSRSGFLGLAFRNVRPGDSVVVFQGLNVPLILRGSSDLTRILFYIVFTLVQSTCEIQCSEPPQTRSLHPSSESDSEDYSGALIRSPYSRTSTRTCTLKSARGRLSNFLCATTCSRD